MKEHIDFNQIYNTYAQKVFRLCLGYASGDVDLAKEWQQETFIKIWQHQDTFNAKSSISTWIYRIAVNICLSDLRKPKKLVHDSDLSQTEDESVDNTNEKDLQIQSMYRCIDKLTPMNKAIILLELEGVPQAIIAEIQGIGHGALRTRLNRIRTSLLKCITNEK